MLALLSVWLGLAALVLSTGMVLHAPWVTDVAIWLVLWLLSPLSMCLAGLILWAYRKEGWDDPGINAQCLQAKVAIGMALCAAGMIYAIIISAEKINVG